MKYFLIIVASGRGTRMGLTQPKQFHKIGNRTILDISIEPFKKLGIFSEIVVTLPPDQLIEIDSCTCIKGGEKRQDSVFCGLKTIEPYAGKSDKVFIHDAVRPHISEKFIYKLVDISKTVDAVVPGAVPRDTIKKVNNNKVVETLKREELIAAQTPQVFNFQKLYSAYQKAYKDNFYATDDAAIFEKYSGAVEVIEGDDNNIKITYLSDLNTFNKRYRIGTGYDVHRFSVGRRLILCGEKIDFEKGLDGHSDADVAVHALIDALLGGAGLGDIGKHFPDTDNKFKDVSSLYLLSETVDMLEAKSFGISNLDITIVAQKPKLAKYLDKMKNNLHECLNIDKEKINIKATTTEGLGFEGRGEGISAQAVAMLWTHLN